MNFPLFYNIVVSNHTKQKRGCRIVKCKIIAYCFLTEIGITIQASIFASVICSDIDACKTSTLGTLIFILINIKCILSDSFESLFVNAMSMFDSEFIKVNFFCTSINVNAILSSNFGELCYKLFDLDFCRNLYIQRWNISLRILSALIPISKSSAAILIVSEVVLLYLKHPVSVDIAINKSSAHLTLTEPFIFKIIFWYYIYFNIIIFKKIFLLTC